MDKKQRERLRRNHVVIVNDLEPRGKVLDSLYEEGVLTENDLERIAAAPTRKERCQLLLSVLPTRGPEAYGSFKTALEAGRYDYLAETLCKHANSNGVTEIKKPSDEKHAMETVVCAECGKFYDSKMKQIFRQFDSDINLVLESHICLFLDNIEPRDLVDQLYQDQVITADESEIMKCGATRRQRCEVFITELMKNTKENAVASLLLALKKKYHFVVDAIMGTGCKTSPVNGDTASTQIQVLKKSRKFNRPGLQAKFGQAKFGQENDHVSSQHFTTSFVDKENKIANHQLVRKAKKRNSGDHIELKVDKPLKSKTKASAVECFLGADKAELHTSKNSDDVDGALIDMTNIIAMRNGPNPVCTIESAVSDNDETKKIKAREHIKTISNDNSSSETPSTGSGEMHNLDPTTKDVKTEETTAITKEQTEIITKQMFTFPSERPSKRLCVAFNYLSTLINQGDFIKFENVSSCLEQRFPTNHDMMCIIGYLHASRDLFRTNFDSAKRHINATMEIVPKTSNPRYFTLELYTAKTRMYVTQKKLEKLQTALDDAVMILETDPVGCTGRAAGWLYINYARNKTAQLGCLNLSKPNALRAYSGLFECAKSSFQRSMTNFCKDGGKDGPFGFGYALCRLVILILRCGDNGLTMDVLQPSDGDISSAGKYLNHLENSDIHIIKILDMHYQLAKCDYQFRRANLVRSLEHAQKAYDLATELNMLEFKEHAYNRLALLRSRAPVTDNVEELDEDEVHRLLFEESSDTDTLTEVE